MLLGPALSGRHELGGDALPAKDRIYHQALHIAVAAGHGGRIRLVVAQVDLGQAHEAAA
jgi:hypothetical protein